MGGSTDSCLSSCYSPGNGSKAPCTLCNTGRGGGDREGLPEHPKADPGRYQQQRAHTGHLLGTGPSRALRSSLQPCLASLPLYKADALLLRLLKTKQVQTGKSWLGWQEKQTQPRRDLHTWALTHHMPFTANKQHSFILL